MVRMHTPGKGIAQSALPFKRTVPTVSHILPSSEPFNKTLQANRVKYVISVNYNIYHKTGTGFLMLRNSENADLKLPCPFFKIFLIFL